MRPNHLTVAKEPMIVFEKVFAFHHTAGKGRNSLELHVFDEIKPREKLTTDRDNRTPQTLRRKLGPIKKSTPCI